MEDKLIEIENKLLDLEEQFKILQQVVESIAVIMNTIINKNKDVLIEK